MATWVEHFDERVNKFIEYMDGMMDNFIKETIPAIAGAAANGLAKAGDKISDVGSKIASNAKSMVTPTAAPKVAAEITPPQMAKAPEMAIQPGSPAAAAVANAGIDLGQKVKEPLHIEEAQLTGQHDKGTIAQSAMVAPTAQQVQTRDQQMAIG